MSEKNVEKNDNLAESEMLDDEFIKAFKAASRPRLPTKAPDWVKKNVINSYKKQHKYLILWYDLKVRFKKYKEALFGTGRGLEIVLAGIVLFILGTVVYYQYTKPQTDSTKTIANKQTPKIEVIPVTNNTNTPDDIKVPNNESNALTVQENKNDSNENKKNVDTYNNKLEQEKDKLAINLTKPNLGNLRAFKPKNSSTVSQAIQLSSVKNVYLGNLISIQENREWILKFSEELKIGIKTRLDWNTEEQPQEANNADAAFKLENGKLVLKDRQRKILWVSKSKLDPKITEPKDLASKIVNELDEKVKSKSNSSFVNKTDSLK